MRKSIEQMIQELIDREGGYSNDPNDAGGETMYGWTVDAARAEGYEGEMKDMSREWAAKAYGQKYFIRPGFNHIYMLSQPIAEELFESGVNMGPRTPSMWIQRLLNAMNRMGKVYPDIKVDASIGPATIGALRAFLFERGAQGEQVLLRGLNCLQGAYYLDITEKREANETFLYGWILNRVEVI